MKTSQKTSDPEANQHKNLTPVLICLALAIITAITFWQLKNCDFINLDDNVYVYENAYVQAGLSWNNIGQAFSAELANVGHWHPITWLSLMLDYSIFGLNPQGFHLINLLFHVMNTILLFLILFRMTKALWPSAFVAVLFAIHPLHVESVAWIVERKDVLSTFFWMLTLGAYSYYVEDRGFRRYFFVLLFFVLGLMSKPMLVTLPFVLLLLDYWPLRRFSEAKPATRIPATDIKSEVSGKKKKSKKKDTAKEIMKVRKPADPEFKWSLIYPLLMEKIPLFALAILSSIVTYVAAHSAGAIHSKAFPSFVRIGNAFISYVAYMGKMTLPVNLAVLYPHRGNVISWQVLGAIAVLLAITVFVIWWIKKSPYLATGWFWYLGTLVPVIGIVQVGAQSMADRYTYISLVGLFIIVAWGFPDLLRKWKYRKEILVASSVICILCLSIMTWIQVGYWQNGITLFDHTLKVTHDNYPVYTMRGVAYAELGNYKQAIEDYSRAIKIKPDYAMAYNNRGNAHVDLGNYKQALEDYSRAIEIKPDYQDAYFNRGNACVHLGNYRQAIEDYSRAIKIKPDYTAAYKNRGIAYARHGNNNLAVNDLKTAARLGDEQARKFLRSRGITW